MKNIVIKDFVPESSASNCQKIMIGDQLIAINDQEISSKSFRNILDTLHGPKHSKVKLTLKRGDQRLRIFQSNCWVSIFEDVKCLTAANQSAVYHVELLRTTPDYSEGSNELGDYNLEELNEKPRYLQV